MSFEFMFALNGAENEAILDLIRNGIEFHMSPERGLPVPTPGSLALFGFGGLGMTRRRREVWRTMYFDLLSGPFFGFVFCVGIMLS